MTPVSLSPYFKIQVYILSTHGRRPAAVKRVFQDPGKSKEISWRESSGRTPAGLVSFQIRIGTMPGGDKFGLVAREIDDRDVPNANLVFGRLRDRNLSVAIAVFAERIMRMLAAMVVAKDTNAKHKALSASMPAER
jgi:hypothetical protein